MIQTDPRIIKIIIAILALSCALFFLFFRLGQYALWDDEATTIFNVPLRIGFFVYKGIEIEPEVLLTIPEEGDGTGIHVLLNVSYNLKASDKTILFFLGGYGFGNSSPIYRIAWDEDESITALNFGGGIKYLVSNSAAIRLEYRYTRYSDDEGDHFRTDNNFYLGVSYSRPNNFTFPALHIISAHIGHISSWNTTI